MEIILCTLMVLIRIFHMLAQPIYSYLARGKKKILPPIQNDLLKISATQLADKIRRKQIKSVEICTLYINRIKEVEPIVNAVVAERFDEALEEAKCVDVSISKASNLQLQEFETTKPLLGVPFTVKESCSLKGMSLSVGCLPRKGYKSDQDGEMVAALRNSGAIPLLVSNTPELCLSWESFNLLKGSTCNPYDSTRSSAGSSGGEGALLGAGASLIGIGSDIAGSIRLPALFCGVFGHKPTPRIASIKGHYPYCMDESYPDYLVIGPMTRYAEDLRTMMKIMVGDKAEQLHFDTPVNISNLNIYVMEDAGFQLTVSSVESSIKSCINKSASHLQTKFQCNIIKDDTFADLSSFNETGGSMLYAIKDIPNVLKWENKRLSTEIIKSLLGHSRYSFNVLTFYTLQNIYRNFVGDYELKCSVMKQLFIDKLGDNGVLLFPTWTGPANRHHEIYFNLGSLLYLVVGNALGLPATHVPCGLDEDGLPIGIQIIAAPNQDRLCLAIAEELEKAFGGWVPPS